MHKTLRYFLVASCLFVGAFAWADEPVITSVTGILVEGGVSGVEIHGSHLGYKAPAPVLKYDRFDDGPEYNRIGPGSGRGDAWYSEEGIHVNGPYYRPGAPRGPRDVYQLGLDFENREQGDAFHWWGLHENNIGHLGYMDFWFQNSTDIGPHRVQMWSFHENASYYPGPGGGNKAFETILIPYDPVHSVWINTSYYLCRYYAPAPQFVNDNYFWFDRPDENWHKIAVQWFDAPGFPVGQYKVWLDEQLIADISGNLQGCSSVGPPPLDLDWIMFYHWVRNDCDSSVFYPEPQAPSEDWFTKCSEQRPEMHAAIDDIYIDDGWSRVEICDSEEWSTRQHCETQIVKDWDNQNYIRFDPTQGSFDDGQTAFLYVIHEGFDAQGNIETHVNAKGFAVTWPSACPETHWCAGGFCQVGALTGDDDTGFHVCVQPDGEVLDCGTSNIHVVTHRCARAACCTGNPHCSPCPDSCGDTTALACE